jgi:hypothetical protein
MLYARAMTEESFVLLCECRNVGELHLVRAALQAERVPMRIEGEATHGVLGAIHGAAQMPRVLVPTRWLEHARTIAAEVVGPFDDAPPEEAEDAAGTSPFREGAADDDAAPDDDAEPDDGKPLVRPKMVGVPLLLALLGLAIGLSHIYARRMKTGLVLLALAVVGGIAFIAGQPWAVGLLVAVELFDVVGGIVAVTRYNRALRAAAR